VRTEEFDYELPSGSIAQAPVEPRDASRLLVLDRKSGQMDHRRFHEIGDYLEPADLLVVNETRVLPARLHGRKAETGGAVETLLLRERYEGVWECLVRPGRRLQPGARIEYGDGVLEGFVLDTLEESGARLVRFTTSAPTLLEAFHQVGEVPLPPYITRELDEPERYQTVYAADERSAAAPTAGLHFTKVLLERLEKAGVRVARVELDVGLDTFRPVTADDPERHVMHREHVRVDPSAAAAVAETRERGGKVVAVGTTTVRALESAAGPDGTVRPLEGETDLFILPGYRFQTVDALVTNFHMPRSTLLMMVSAFAGRDLTLRAYASAREHGYRFLSFGDAMLIL
jgi:S-adenosylmethionine:tRNA ribosyltransferase-isomerase